MGTAIIMANKEQLQSIGIDYKITGLTGKVIHYFSSGYVELEVDHEYSGHKFTNRFDIPKKWLRIIK